MKIIERVFREERLMRALTGLNFEEFYVLLPSFEKAWNESLTGKNRQRGIGGGCKGLLPEASHKLFYILFYMKTYPTYDVAGFMFGAVRSAACGWMKKFLPVLEKALGRTINLPKRKISSVEEFYKLFPEVKDVFIDGSERPTQRPRKSKSLRKRYSGKKKTHTRKNTIICDENRKILFVSPTHDGRVHDFRQLQKNSVIEHIPGDVGIWLDKGYQGIKNILKNGNTVMIPHKKPRKSELTTEQKAENRVISGIRMVVEHAIGGMKRFRCMTDPFRNKFGKDDQMIVVAASLWNLHLLCKG
jgi:hypothetical protein